jgi:hypothetical protein
MKITRYGTVILTEGPVRVEDWLVEREPEDPTEATTEQLLLEFAIPWAQGRLQDTVNSAMRDVFREAVNQKTLALSLPKLASLPQADGDSN